MATHQLKLLVLFLLPFGAFAQSPVFNIGLQGGIPSREFKQSSPGIWGIGVESSFLLPVSETPFYVGLNASYMIYGKKVVQEDLYVGNSLREFDVVRNNNIASSHLVLRAQPDLDSPILPYAEVLIGGRLFYTKAKIKENVLEDALEESTEFHDWTFSYGWAAGFNIEIDSEIFLDLKLTYLEGSRTEYLDSKSIHFDDVSNTLTYDVKTSRTPMFLPQIGIRVLLE